jgi:hypothetical protein
MARDDRDTRELKEALLRVRDETLAMRLSEALRAGAMRRDPTLGQQPRIEIRTPDSSAYAVGHLLLDLDREMRRSALFLRRPSSQQLETPTPPKGRAMDIEAAEPGSLGLICDAVDAVAAVLLSDPVQFTLTLTWFWEHRPRSWGLRHPAGTQPIDTMVAQVNETAQAAAQVGQATRYDIRYEPDTGAIRIRFESTPA